MTGSVFEISNRLVDDIVELSPIEATIIGVEGFDHLWDDLSPEGLGEKERLFGDYQREFGNLTAGRDRWEELASRVGLEFVETELEQITEGDAFCDLNTVASPLTFVREVFDQMDTTTAAGWENVAIRMETIGGALEGYRRTLEEGSRRSLWVARRQVLAAIQDARIHAGEDSYFGAVADRHRAWRGEESRFDQRIEAAALVAREAFAGFARYLESHYLADAPVADEVGLDRYMRHARRHLGMDIDPRETYRWGWAEVAALRRRMTAVAAQIDPSASLAAVVQTLKTDRSRSATDPDHFIRIMTERQRLALAELDGVHFDVPPAIKRLDVKIAPPGGSLGAYYVQPSEDFSRPGTVWYSLGDQKAIPLWDEVSTAYHEGFPGHHLQCGVALSLADRLSRLHRVAIWHPGYGEGWALYTERLMDELGYLEKPEYVLGMLSAEMLRACRVVIDLGLHLGYPIPTDAVFHPGEDWTFATAVELLTDFAFLYPAYANSEVVRYLGWPGQAISYKVGERVLLELRAEWKARNPGETDLKEFHARVLGSGAVGLDHLRELVLGTFV
jgi:uncharacterized protein (DUF885 family)